MHLLNTKTLRREYFVGDNVPPYAILSHRWEADEVTFEDYGRKRVRKWAGQRKIEALCQRAALDGYSYAWIDTCCIDKRSSAELSEAINSMFTVSESCR